MLIADVAQPRYLLSKNEYVGWENHPSEGFSQVKSCALGLAAANDNQRLRLVATNGALNLQTENGPFNNDSMTLAYDNAGRVNSRTVSNTTTTFAYDGLGRRLKQTVGATETRYLWCGAAICQQRSNTDVVQKRFFAEGEYVLTGTKKYLTLTDHLGSVRDVIDITTTPTLVGSFDYTPYGAVARSWGTVTPGYTYAGLFAHPQTGLLLSATRAYEPGKGRFLNRDALAPFGYPYVDASPLLKVDPLGLSGSTVFPGRMTPIPISPPPVTIPGTPEHDEYKRWANGLGDNFHKNLSDLIKAIDRWKQENCPLLRRSNVEDEGEDDDQKRCQDVYRTCRNSCIDEYADLGGSLGSPWLGNCINVCMEDNGCDGGAYPFPTTN
jgi:RHS repeat-associated protein